MTQIKARRLSSWRARPPETRAGRKNRNARKAASSRIAVQNTLPSGPVTPPEKYTLPRGTKVSSVPTQRLPLSAVPNRKFSA